MEQAVKMFPSPVGELYFSIHFRFFIWGTRRVSVPCRGTIFLNTNWQMEKCTRLAFPSPVGELYFSIHFRFFIWGTRRVSVPCRGTIFLNKSLRDIAWKFLPVSVPCRGTIFLNRMSDTYYLSVLVSVPCRGTIFLNNFVFVHIVSVFLFPSPVGELYFSIPSLQSRHQSELMVRIAWEKYFWKNK